MGEIRLENHNREVAALRVELFSPVPVPVVGTSPVQGGFNFRAVLKHTISVKEGSSEEFVESMYVADA